MLEIDHQESVDSAADATCRVVLPDRWTEYFDRLGALPAAPTDLRRFARKYFRTRIVIRMLSTLPVFGRNEQPVATLGKDISRGGLAFLSHEQLFPGECGEIQTTHRWLQFEVVRCRKHGEACYEIGAVMFKDTD